MVEYRDVAGFPGYRVGDDGSVWSCWKKGWQVAEISSEWKLLRGNLMEIGYVSYRLRKEHGKSVAVSGHRIVLLAFRGEAFTGGQGRHLDGDKTNNALDNLSWGTPAENSGDQISHGKSRPGDQSPFAKLKNHQARIVPGLYQLGFSDNQIGQIFKVHENTIRDLRKGRSWTSVTGIQPTRIRKSSMPEYQLSGVVAKEKANR